MLREDLADRLEALSRQPRLQFGQGSDESVLVGLTGALSNHAMAERLPRLNRLRKELLRKAAVSLPSAKRPRPRSGAIQKAVVEALSATTEPMRIRDLQAAVERLLSMRVSKSTVNSCLSVGAGGANPRFERVSPGRYRLRRV